MNFDNLRVGYVVEPPYETFTVNEILELRRQGAQITVFNAFRPFAQPDSDAEKIRHDSRYFPERYRGVLFDNLLSASNSPGAYVKIALYIAKHGLSKRLLALAAHFDRLVRQLGIQHLHAAFGTVPATVAMFTAWLSGISYSVTYHAYDVFLPNPTLVDKINNSRFSICPSHFLKDYISSNFAGVEADKLRTLYLGIGIDRFHNTIIRGVNDPCVITSVARLHPMKGLQYLLGACEILHRRGINFECNIIGNGELEEVFKEGIKKNGLQHCMKLLGYKTPDEVKKCLEQSDIFVLPCITESDGNRDGMPFALMEAMAMELPVVSTPVAGIPELVTVDCGLLVQEKSAEDLAEALEKLVCEAKLRVAMGKRGREIIQEKFNLAKSVNTLGNFFLEAE
jgi:colanic acid/amylovoran biosynthesis glycosyltransferase